MEHILEDLKQNKQISSRANIALTTITNKRKSPDIDLITKLKNLYAKEGVEDKPLKERIEDNPLFRLSIEDFENMCKDESIKEIIATALNINIKSLTAFCKYVNIFKENIDLSPNTIKEKMKIKKIAIKDLSTDLFNGTKDEPLKLHHLPEDILKHITQKSLKSLFKYKLVDGIPEDELDINALCENPNALYYLITKGKHINYYHLSNNPNPIVFKLLKEEIKVNPEVHINWHLLSSKTDSEAIELLSKRKNFENNLSKEEYDRLKLPYKINWKLLSANLKTIKILKEEYDNNPNSDKLVWSVLCSNPKAIEILTEEYEKNPNSNKLVWSALCSNPNPEIIKLLEKEIKVNPHHIDINALAGNKTTEVIKFLENNFNFKNYEYVNDLDYDFFDILFSNSNSDILEIIKNIIPKRDHLPVSKLSRYGTGKIIAFLREKDNKYRISWSELASNPSPEAMALFKENILKFKITPVICKVLSENPNPEVITLLEKEFIKNRDNPEILWRILSSNKNAIDLLRKRMDYENSLSKKRYQNLNMYHMINWDIVSKNPNAIELIKERIKYQNLPENKDRLRDIIEGQINWKALSTNPSIFTIE